MATRKPLRPEQTRRLLRAEVHQSLVDKRDRLLNLVRCRGLDCTPDEVIEAGLEYLTVEQLQEFMHTVGRGFRLEQEQLLATKKAKLDGKKG